MSHQHHRSDPSISTSRLFLTMTLNFVITAVEIIGGILSGSLSLISDALHTLGRYAGQPEGLAGVGGTRDACALL